MSLFQLPECESMGSTVGLEKDRIWPGESDEELSWMGQAYFTQGLMLRLCSSALGAQERICSTNVLPGGISVGVGEGLIQFIMGDCIY